MNLPSMAWRNVWRNARRSAVTIAAMTLSLWVLILYSGLIEGYIVGMEEDIIEVEIGDIRITTEAYPDDPSLFEVIPDAEAVTKTLEAAGYRAAPRLLGGGLGAVGDQSAAVSLRGLDLARDADVLAIADRIASGTWLSADDPKGVVVGRRLARSLGAAPGDELVVLSQGADGSMANDLFLIRGLLGPVSDATDRTAVFMAAPSFRELMTLDTGAHEIVVRRPADTTLEEATERAHTLVPQHRVKSWAQLLPQLAEMLQTSRVAVYFMFMIMFVAVAILVLNAVLMAVFERIKEFGVLKAIGVPPTAVLALILLETLVQVGISIVLGTLLALPAAWYMSTVGIDVGTLGGTDVMGMALREIWYGIFTPAAFVIPPVMLTALSLLAALWPAMRAALISPVEAMRHG